MKEFNCDCIQENYDGVLLSETNINKLKEFCEKRPFEKYSGFLGQMYGLKVYISQYLPDNMMVLMLGYKVVKIVKFEEGPSK